MKKILLLSRENYSFFITYDILIYFSIFVPIFQLL